MRCCCARATASPLLIRGGQACASERRKPSDALTWMGAVWPTLLTRAVIAVSPNSNDIVIYNVVSVGSGPPKFTRAWTLREHDALITGLDWAATTNRIVSSSQDRNAYVWELQENEWRPTLVIVRLQRAATSVSWSPNGACACVRLPVQCRRARQRRGG